MNKSFAIILFVIAAIVAGFFIGRSFGPAAGTASSGDTASGRDILYWVAPMDPNYRRDGPGKSPMGMDLVPVYADEVDSQPGVVSIDPVIINNLGVRTAIAMRGELPRRIETVGYVAYDENTVEHVHTRVEGWIEKLAVTATGDRLERGQLLFEIYSPTLVNAQQEFLTAHRSGNAVLLQASRDRLAALGVTRSEVARLEKDGRVMQRVRVFAESDGVIAHLGVRQGIYVTPMTEVMSVAKLDRVWVIAEVFERQSSWVRPGQRATVTLDYLPGATFVGTVDYVYPELDPKTRTLKVRLAFDNTGEQLRPNMFSRVTIEADDAGRVVHVPKSAVIRGGSVNRVVVALGEGRFRSVPVRLGIESGDRIAIRSGIAEGDEIVVSGQFLIDSESNIESALSRMEEQGHEGHDMHRMEQQDHEGHDMRGMDQRGHEGHDMRDRKERDHDDHGMHRMESDP